MEWLFAARDSVEMASLPWSLVKLSRDSVDTPAWKRVDDFLSGWLQHVEPILAVRDGLAEAFSIADILMAEWRTCSASSTGSTGWRGTSPVVPPSRAPRLGRRS